MMDTMKSFKGYGKVDPLEEQAFRRKTRKRFIILIVSALLLCAIIIGVVIGTVAFKKNKDTNKWSSTPSGSVASLRAVCNETRYPDSCFSSISALDTSNTTDPRELFKLSLHVVINSLHSLSSLPQTLMDKTDEPSVKLALGVCEQVFDDAVDKLNDTLSSMEAESDIEIASKLGDLETWLSAVITDQETCADALDEINNGSSILMLEEVKDRMKNSSEYASNSLSIVTNILKILAEFDVPFHRKLLGVGGEFPEWVGSGDRRLLQQVMPKANLTVAKDGSGDCETISAALERIPKNSKKRFVIYVKKGVYVENVVVDKSMWNLMIYGDGKNMTVVSGSLNFVDGTPTFSTPTFAAVGKGFIAKDMGFMNTAGAEKHQAVALRSGSDLSVFYRCSFNAFQDTLYSHSNRQLYRECDIIGTVDFIFGNAAVVLQNCTILPRQPMPNQFVTITAQGKVDPNQNTGISIHKCNIFPYDNLTVPAYLGRPWKNYSTTVVMRSNIASFLNPLGWTEWVNDVVPPSTIFYAEYQNTGLGSSVANRVTWPGYRKTITLKQASQFTVENFIQASTWLPSTNVTYEPNL